MDKEQFSWPFNNGGKILATFRSKFPNCCLCLDTSIKRLLFGGLRSFLQMENTPVVTSTPLIQKYTFVTLQILCLWEETSQLYLHIPRSLSVQVGWSCTNYCYKAVWYKANTLYEAKCTCMLNECMLPWTNGHPHNGFAVAWRSEEVDTGCHFYRWALQRLLPHVGQHSRQGHPCCSVVSEISFQTHLVARDWPGGNDLCPLLMQVAILKGLKTGRKQWAVCPFYAWKMRSWAQGTYTADALKKPQQLPSGCRSCPGVQGISVSCLPEAGRRQALLAPLYHCYSTHKNPPCPQAVQQGCSQAAHPPV